MKKAILSLILIIAVLFSVSIVSFAADPVVKLESNGVTDNTLKVDVNLSDNPGIIVMRLKVNYNTDAIKLTKIDDKAQLGEQVHTDALDSKDVYLYWSNPLATKDFTFNGTVATLEFEVLDSSKKAEISLSYNLKEGDIDIINYDLEKVDFKTDSASFDLSGSTDSQNNTSSVPTNKKEQGLGAWFYMGVGALVLLIVLVVVMVYVKNRIEEDN